MANGNNLCLRPQGVGIKTSNKNIGGWIIMVETYKKNLYGITFEELEEGEMQELVGGGPEITTVIESIKAATAFSTLTCVGSAAASLIIATVITYIVTK